MKVLIQITLTKDLNLLNKKIKNKKYTFIGISEDFEACKEEILKLLPKPTCNYYNCSFYNTYQPSVNNDKFIVIYKIVKAWSKIP